MRRAQYVTNGLFAGEDQAVMASTCRRHRGLCSFVRPWETSGDVWFGLQSVLHGVRMRSKLDAQGEVVTAGYTAGATDGTHSNIRRADDQDAWRIGGHEGGRRRKTGKKSKRRRQKEGEEAGLHDSTLHKKRKKRKQKLSRGVDLV